MVTAKCIKDRNPWGDIPTTLTLGEIYEVKHVEMCSAITFVFLKEKKGVFNSLCFEFYEDGKPLDIFSDIRFNPYLTHLTMRILVAIILIGIVAACLISIIKSLKDK